MESAGRGDVGLEKVLGANKLSSAPRQESEPEWQRQRERSHEKSPKAKQMLSVEEHEALGSLGNPPIHLKFKQSVLTRSGSEPYRKRRLWHSRLEDGDKILWAVLQVSSLIYGFTL
jgi:hypothetical protein